MTQDQRQRITSMLEYADGYVNAFAENAAWIWANMPERRDDLISKAWGHALDADALTALLAATETPRGWRMTRDEINRQVREIVTGYDMEPEDATVLYEIGKIAALRAETPAPADLVALVPKTCPVCGFVEACPHVAVACPACLTPKRPEPSAPVDTPPDELVLKNHAQDLRDAGLLLAPKHAAPPPLVTREWVEAAAKAEEAAGDPDITVGAPLDPPTLVALVQEWQAADRVLDSAGNHDDAASERYAAAERRLIAWTPAVPVGTPIVSDTHMRAAERARKMFTSVPETDAERNAIDPDYGLAPLAAPVDTPPRGTYHDCGTACVTAEWCDLANRCLAECRPTDADAPLLAPPTTPGEAR
jgi:hypothetical protein